MNTKTPIIAFSEDATAIAFKDGMRQKTGEKWHKLSVK